MADFFSNNISDFQDQDKQAQSYNEQIEALLADNNLARKRLPEEKNSLLKALSDTLYFSPKAHEETQEKLIDHLKGLLVNNNLPPKLNMFKGNSILLKDFVMNPHLPGFEKINLELASSMFKVRVIIYGLTEDSYLSSLIINKNHRKSIELFRTKNNHYDPVYSVEFLTKAGMCQNFVLNIIDQALNGKAGGLTDYNRDNYINYEYNNWMASKQAQNGLEQFRITRGRHKKSFSDNFTKNYEAMEEQQMKIYNMFVNMKPPDDFLKKINPRKDTAESNFSINADLGFVDEAWQDAPPVNYEYAIKNYPIASPGISSARDSRKDLRVPSPQPQRTRSINHNNVFLHENLSMAEMDKLERSTNKDNVAISPAYYPSNVDLAGLTPTSYGQPKSYNFSEALPGSTSTLDNSSPTLNRGGSLQNLQPMSYSHSYAETPTQAQFPGVYQPITQQGQMYNSNPYLKRSETDINLQMQMQMQMQIQQGQYGVSHLQAMQYGQMQMPLNYMAGRQAKKGNVVEDANRKYTGRLKFFDETKNYGFIIMDDDGSDIFVHYDDLVKAGLNKDMLRTAKSGNVIKLTFSCMQYVGKYNKSRKAVDVQCYM